MTMTYAGDQRSIGAQPFSERFRDLGRKDFENKREQIVAGLLVALVGTGKSSVGSMESGERSGDQLMYQR